MKDKKETRRQELLKELNDVQSLLDDESNQAAGGKLDEEQIRKLAAQRANPFLSSPSPSNKPAPASSRPTLSAAELDSLVDELVAEALPKLERTLRLKLREALRRK